MNQRRLTLARARRPLLGVAALLCFAAAAVLAPSDVRSQLDPARHDITAEPAPHAETPLTPIVPAGDAFAPRAVVDDDARPAPPQPPALRLPRLPQAGLPIASTVPVMHLRITAIATGAHPTAIVEDGGDARLVAIGDALDGSRITAIGDDAIALANGRRLSLEPAVAAP
jgi:hypothetical protein